VYQDYDGLWWARRNRERSFDRGFRQSVKPDRNAKTQEKENKGYRQIPTLG
jgi:hypothetical protein